MGRRGHPQEPPVWSIGDRFELRRTPTPPHVIRRLDGRINDESSQFFSVRVVRPGLAGAETDLEPNDIRELFAATVDRMNQWVVVVEPGADSLEKVFAAEVPAVVDAIVRTLRGERAGFIAHPTP